MNSNDVIYLIDKTKKILGMQRQALFNYRAGQPYKRILFSIFSCVSFLSAYLSFPDILLQIHKVLALFRGEHPGIHRPADSCHFF